MPRTGGPRCATISARCLCTSDDDAAAPDTAAVVDRALAVWRAGHAVVLRGLLAPAARGSVRGRARLRRARLGHGATPLGPDCLAASGAGQFPQQRRGASRRFRDACPAAWSAIARAVAAVDRATFRRFEGGEPTVAAAFKQADYLVYQGGLRRRHGWHDHYGESLLLCVALLGDGPFEGGSSATGRSAEATAAVGWLARRRGGVAHPRWSTEWASARRRACLDEHRRRTSKKATTADLSLIAEI